MFNLPDFKNFAGISPSDDSHDPIIVKVFLPAARAQLSAIMALDKATPAKAEGLIRLTRDDTNPPREIVISNIHRFSTPEGLIYSLKTPPASVTIATDKSEQDFTVVATDNGAIYNNGLPQKMTVNPAIPGGVFQSIAFSGGKDDFGVIPENSSVLLALYILMLYFYENRQFGLKKDMRPEIYNQILGLVDPQRNASRFVTQKIQVAE